MNPSDPFLNNPKNPTFWGKSAAHRFIYLFIGLVLGIGLAGWLYLQYGPSFGIGTGSKDFLNDSLKNLRSEKAKLESAIQQTPTDPELFHHLGNMDVKLNLLEDARKAYEKEIGLNPSSASGYLNLGNVLFLKADEDPRLLDQAIACYSQSVILDPHSVEGHFNLAYALYAKKDKDAALGELEEVLRLNPHHAQALALKKRIAP